MSHASEVVQIHNEEELFPHYLHTKEKAAKCFTSGYKVAQVLQLGFKPKSTESD